MNKLVGIDIGGSHITASKVSDHNLELVQSSFQRERVDSAADAKSIVKAWSEVIKNCTGKEKDSTIGIAIPGPFDYENGICLMQNQGKYDALYGLNIKTLLAKELGISTENIRFNNDAACFLQGEVYKVAQSSKTAIGITLGTGLGTAFIIDGKSFDADLWNTPFKGGIIEDYISSRWFVSEFKARSGKEIKDVEDLVENYPDYDLTKDLFRDFSKNLADFLLFFIKLKKAECIVIGGNISKAEAFFLNDVKQLLYKGLGYEIPLYISSLGEQAALIGASVLFKSDN